MTEQEKKNIHALCDAVLCAVPDRRDRIRAYAPVIAADLKAEGMKPHEVAEYLTQITRWLDR